MAKISKASFLLVFLSGLCFFWVAMHFRRAPVELLEVPVDVPVGVPVEVPMEVAIVVRTYLSPKNKRLEGALDTWLQNVAPPVFAYLFTDREHDASLGGIDPSATRFGVFRSDCPFGHNMTALNCRTQQFLNWAFAKVASTSSLGWIVYADDDLYINSPALLAELRRRSPLVPLYLGSNAFRSFAMSGFKIANHGMGLHVFSRATLQALMALQPPLKV